MGSPNRRKAVRRAAATLAVTTTPAPVLGVVMTGHGLPWALAPVTAGIVTVATMRAKPAPAPIPAPVQCPARMTVQACVVPEPEPEPEPDLNALRALITAEHYWSEEVA